MHYSSHIRTCFVCYALVIDVVPLCVFVLQFIEALPERELGPHASPALAPTNTSTHLCSVWLRAFQLWLVCAFVICRHSNQSKQFVCCGNRKQQQHQQRCLGAWHDFELCIIVGEHVPYWLRADWVEYMFDDLFLRHQVRRIRLIKCRWKQLSAVCQQQAGGNLIYNH